MQPWLYSCVVFVTEPHAHEWVDDMDRRINHAVDIAWGRGIVKGGAAVVIVTGWRAGSGFTNTIRIIRIPGGEKASRKVQVLATTKEAVEPPEKVTFS